jgi:hypothetical protein
MSMEQRPTGVRLRLISLKIASARGLLTLCSVGIEPIFDGVTPFYVRYCTVCCAARLFECKD